MYHIYLLRRRVQRVVLPSNCTEGTLYWNYPEKTLKVVVPEENGNFTFCVGYVHDPFVKRAQITTRSGSRKINLPSKKGMVFKDYFTVILHTSNVSPYSFFMSLFLYCQFSLWHDIRNIIFYTVVVKMRIEERDGSKSRTNAEVYNYVYCSSKFKKWKMCGIPYCDQLDNIMSPALYYKSALS